MWWQCWNSIKTWQNLFISKNDTFKADQDLDEDTIHTFIASEVADYKQLRGGIEFIGTSNFKLKIYHNFDDVPNKRTGLQKCGI